MKLVTFRHTQSNDLGSFAPVLARAGFDIDVINTWIDPLDGFDPLAPDLLIVMGGPPGVYQSDIYPFLAAEKKILEKRLAQDLPTLGICLGSQLMAAALGARVYKAPQGPEVGWFPLQVNEDGQKTPARHLDGSLTSMVHWHGDTFDLPDGATLLASSAHCKHQIYTHGRNALALQCHPESTQNTMEQRFISAADAVAAGRLDLQKLRAQTQEHVGTLEQQTEKFLTGWLQEVGLWRADAEKIHA